MMDLDEIMERRKRGEEICRVCGKRLRKNQKIFCSEFCHLKMRRIAKLRKNTE